VADNSRFTADELAIIEDIRRILECEGHQKLHDRLSWILGVVGRSSAHVAENDSGPTSDTKFRCGVAKAIASVAHSGCTKIEGHDGACTAEASRQFTMAEANALKSAEYVLDSAGLDDEREAINELLREARRSNGLPGFFRSPRCLGIVKGTLPEASDLITRVACNMACALKKHAFVDELSPETIRWISEHDDAAANRRRVEEQKRASTPAAVAG
jgi:hypothetical protein